MLCLSVNKFLLKSAGTSVPPLNEISCTWPLDFLSKRVWYLMVWLLYWLATISIFWLSYRFVDLIIRSSSTLRYLWFDRNREIVHNSSYLNGNCWIFFLYCNGVQNCYLCVIVRFALFCNKALLKPGLFTFKNLPCDIKLKLTGIVQFV